MNFIRSVLCATMAVTPLSAAVEDPSPQHVSWMKEIDSANEKINKGDALETNARRMAQLMKEVAAFWGPRDAPVGRLADEASVAALELADRKGDAWRNKAAISASCRRCHLAHRRGPQGGMYKMK